MKKHLIIFLLSISTMLGFINSVTVDAKSVEPVVPLEQYTEINEVSSFNNIVIFIRFADEETYTAPYDYNYYESMFNGVDQVSLRDFYLEVSYNQLTIDSYLVNDNDQIIFYTDDQPRAYYEPYDIVTNTIGYNTINHDEREHELLKKAVDYIDENNLIDSSIELDQNNDGDIDSISFLVSGEDNGWMSLLWPHKWEMSSYYNYVSGEYYPTAPTINGSYAYTYTFELLGNSTSYNYQVDVSVLAHETFHLISAPDLYHYYRYDWIEPVGYWGLMESLGTVPHHMLGYMKEVYGNWIPEVDEITSNGTYTLYPLQESGNNLYRIDTGYSNEFVYLEYRLQEGLYDSELPNSGLLVYRVDEDYYDLGNVEGYYRSDGSPSNEIFIFRPGITDVLPPIEFADENNSSIDEDGSIDDAVLSQNNLYDEMGIDTDIQMFYSDGSLMDIKIFNVVEHDGYITFEVSFGDAYINLVNDYGISLRDKINFVQATGTYYSVTIENINVEYETYYTLDGTTPTDSSTLYTGGEIEIDSINNHLKVGFYAEGVQISTLEQFFRFVSEFETSHRGYGNSKVEHWYLNYEKLTQYSITFNNEFHLENLSDYLFIYANNEITSYTFEDLKNIELEYINFGLIFTLITDSTIDTDYGFKAEITIEHIFEGLGYYMNDESELDIDVNSGWIDPEIELVGEGSDTAYYTVESDILLDTVGEYSITYKIYDEDDILIDTLVRNVTIGDYSKPIITLLGPTTIYLEVFEDYIEYGATVYDNYTVSEQITIVNNVKNDYVSVYQVYYQISDDAGNKSDVVIRYIYVQDTTNPTAELYIGLDTIYVGQEHIDGSVTAYDNYFDRTTVEVVSDLDINTPGEYLMIYNVKDASGNTIVLKRFINVIEREDILSVDFTCDASFHTYKVGDILHIPDCSINDDYDISVDTSNVDMTTPGTYEIIYSTEINEETYEFKTYIFVLEEYQIELHYFDNRKGLYL